MKLYLLEPRDPGVAWAPFTGVRPIAELRAGVWKIRERWEAALDLETIAVLGEHSAHFHEGFEPPCVASAEISGPAIIAASWFAPTGAPVALGPDIRRLMHGRETVAWVVPAGEQWKGPTSTGDTVDVDGMLLRGTFDLLAALDRFLVPDCLGFSAGPVDPIPSGSLIMGDPALVLCRGAMVEPGVMFDTRKGAVVVEAGCEVRFGSRLEGPLYIGERCRIVGDAIRYSAIGPRCTIRGELSNAVFLGYANKAHDGFVGHSVVGHWANLGAGTTTSNLKNTYGEVALQVGEKKFGTQRQFLGSLVGDHAKTAIGTMLATGTVIGAGANVFGRGQVPKYVPPMAWGLEGEVVTEDGFLNVAGRVMPRREVILTDARREALRATWKKATAP